MIFATFVVIFLGGPLIFRSVMGAGIAQRPLGFIAALLALSAIALRYGGEDMWGSDLRIVFASLFLIWMAWIMVLVLGVRAMQSDLLDVRAARWARVIGAVGTTVPWFGIASANWIEG